MKKILLSLIGLVVIGFAFTLLSGYSLVIGPNDSLTMEDIECVNGKINPLGSFDFSKDSWKMYVQISSSDMNELPDNMRKVNFIKTSDLVTIKNIQEKWSFSCNEGEDISTAESKLFLFKDGDLVFESAIVISDSIEGLQSHSFGWIHSKEGIISSELENFERQYFPIVFL
ncbi:MAG: hypothetical protein Aureis2KO_32010 [Aureisphaera sp.]